MHTTYAYYSRENRGRGRGEARESSRARAREREREREREKARERARARENLLTGKAVLGGGAKWVSSSISLIVVLRADAAVLSSPESRV
jgi:hypothetical protein